MPDISMCNNDKCPLAKKCYRHEAKPNEHRQTYAEFTYINGKCDGYYPILIGKHGEK